MQYKKVVSFDFFDTLCGRRCGNPEDIFELVGETVGICGFREARINAQTQAFVSMNSKQKSTIHIREIYECLSVEHRSIDEMVEIEIMHELEQSVANQEICKIYRECTSCAQILVAITSDMYLDSTFFVACLEKHGLPLPDIMLISCEHDAKKRDDGSLFRILLQRAAEYGVEEVVHIGDNPVSDIENALLQNIVAILYSGSTPYEIDLKPALDKRAKSVAPCASNLKEWDTPRIGADVIYSLAVVARQLLEFSRDTAIKMTTNTILFAARDGYILSELWKRLKYDGMHGIRGVYFPCSRAVAIKCGTDAGNYDDFSEQFSSGIEGLLTSDLFDRMGLECVPTSCLSELGFQRRLCSNSKIFADNICNVYKNRILSQIASEKNALAEYLGSIKILEPTDNRVLLFDIGWTGTSQLFLSRFFAALGIESEGVYLALNEGSRRVKERKKAMTMHSACRSLGHADSVSKAVFSSRLLFEYFFSAPHPTILGFKQYNRESKALNLLYDERNRNGSMGDEINSNVRKEKLLTAVIDMAACIDPAQAALNFSNSLIHLISCAQPRLLDSLPDSRGFDGWTYTKSNTKMLSAST